MPPRGEPDATRPVSVTVWVVGGDVVDELSPLPSPHADKISTAKVMIALETVIFMEITFSLDGDPDCSLLTSH